MSPMHSDKLAMWLGNHQPRNGLCHANGMSPKCENPTGFKVGGGGSGSSLRYAHLYKVSKNIPTELCRFIQQFKNIL